MYGGWLARIAGRFQEAFDKIQVTHNFEFGDEYEIAICKVLRGLLPARASVCRGYVVAANGSRAGDDVIIFDSGRFPTLRALALEHDGLAQKEEVPAEAVLAYIEAKHTVKLDASVEDGQSLAKALLQVARVKAVPRPPVELTELDSRVNLGPALKVTVGEGWPSCRNPLYAAVWARHVESAHGDRAAGFNRRMNELMPMQGLGGADAVVAGPFAAFHAALPKGRSAFALRPFHCQGTDLFTSGAELLNPLGFAAVHLLWAIEWVQLGRIPWEGMVEEALREGWGESG